MSDCLRFLINVDQCFAMSSYDMFFYRLQSEYRFQYRQVQLNEKEGYHSLRNVFADVRICLNKYPYFGQFDEYQIIAAMSLAGDPVSSEWEQTLLYRLLRIRHEMLQENIWVEQGDTSRRAMNLIVFRENCNIPPTGNDEIYMSGGRLRKECKVLLQKAGLTDPGMTTEQMQAALAKSDLSDIERNLINTFIDHQRTTEQLYSEVNHYEETSNAEMSFHDFFKEFVENVFKGFQVFELFIVNTPHAAAMEKMCAVLRMVDYINSDFSEKGRGGQANYIGSDMNERTPNGQAMTSLSERCLQVWKNVADRDIETIYSEQLFRYRQRLQNMHNLLDNGQIDDSHADSVKEHLFREEDEIDVSEEDGEIDETDFSGVLNAFLKRRFSIGKVREEWTNAYGKLHKGLGDMSGSLRRYAFKLGSVYTERMSRRKKESLQLEHERYTLDNTYHERIQDLEIQRVELMGKLREYQQKPSLSFQDQLNIESELELEGARIHNYAKRIDAINRLNHLLLVLVVLAVFVLHYSILQPFVYTTLQSLTAYAAYVGTVFVSLNFTWRVPYRHYRSCIKRSVKNLQAKLDIYTRGYTEQRGLFRNYINTLDKVDVVTHNIELYRFADKQSSELNKGKGWHKARIDEHLMKLRFFSGLIDKHEFDAKADPVTLDDLFMLNKNGINDVVDCSVYWPQENGENI